MSGSMPGEVTFLTRPGCRGSTLMRAHLDAALVSERLPTTYAIVDISAPDADHRWRGYPTPTVLLDGLDLFGLQPPASGQAPT